MRATQRLIAPDERGPDQRLFTSARGPVAAGFAILALAFGGFGTWAAIAQLSSAAIAPGVVVLEGSRKTMQHLEGGIVKEILVKEGSGVEAGQVLIRLDETRPQAIYDLLLGQYHAARALEARLIAERDERKAIDIPEELFRTKDDPEVAEILAGQEKLFEARRTSLHGQIDILRQRIAQTKELMAGLRAQRRSTEKQIELIAEEEVGVRELFEKGYERKPRLLALQRQAAELEGDRGQYIARTAEAKQGIGESRLRILDLNNSFQREVADQLRAVQDRAAELRDRLRAQEDILRRLEIRTPQTGVVVGLQVHTVGGVIRAGEPILDIVPSGDRLIIETHISPSDIDVVHPGLTAQVRLSAYESRLTPTIDGEVVHVSADRFVDQRTGSAYYLARVEVSPSELEELEDVELYPGMPAEVMIVTGQQTAFEYFVGPITDRFRHAFREQ